ncbi:hypothetical protein B0I35DRAFT_445528 [Stachybotrys elegans]|uniref:Aflatoxin regulatory protein domain-containing protein n=1 Tax=Stachybotrys elegans TaxID=80388 RepID=A0A8K0WJI9_9HYPO|nr:hypothetical protein B0I35DRAFT_445528 [Stachybotrys elegans]
MQGSETSQDEMIPWPNVWHLQSSHADTITAAFPIEPQPSFPHDHSTTTNDNHLGTSLHDSDAYAIASIPHMLGDFEELDMSPTPTNPPADQSPEKDQEESHRPDSTGPPGEFDSYCVRDSCRVINDLEAYIGSGMNDFKIIIGLIRQVLGKLSNLITMQQSSRNQRCIMLYTVILYQVLALAEVCLPNVLGETQQQQPVGLGSLPLGIGLGDYSYNAEEKTIFQIQTLLKAVRQVMDTIDNLKVLTGLGPRRSQQPEADATMGQSRIDCFLDLET